MCEYALHDIVKMNTFVASKQHYVRNISSIFEFTMFSFKEK